MEMEMEGSERELERVSGEETVGIVNGSWKVSRDKGDCT